MTMELELPTVQYLMRLFDEFAEAGILQMMIRAAMKVFTQLMDPNQRSKFLIRNLSDLGDMVEENIHHWFNINIIFQARRNWLKTYFGIFPVPGYTFPPIPFQTVAEIGLPN